MNNRLILGALASGKTTLLQKTFENFTKVNNKVVWAEFKGIECSIFLEPLHWRGIPQVLSPLILKNYNIICIDECVSIEQLNWVVKQYKKTKCIFFIAALIDEDIIPSKIKKHFKIINLGSESYIHTKGTVLQEFNEGLLNLKEGLSNLKKAYDKYGVNRNKIS